jgi:hypothetical protein
MHHGYPQTTTIFKLRFLKYDDGIQQYDAPFFCVFCYLERL